MLDRIRDAPRQAARALLCGFLPKLATSALTTLVVSALFAQIAPERPVLAPQAPQWVPQAAVGLAPVPVDRLWPRDPDLARVFSFTLDTAGQPFSSFTPSASASVTEANPWDSAQAATSVASTAANADLTSGAPLRKAPARTASKSREGRTAIAMLPPVRPAVIEATPAADATAESASLEPQSARLLGMTLPGWVPTGEAVMTTVTALSGAVRDRLSF